MAVEALEGKWGEGVGISLGCFLGGGRVGWGRSLIVRWIVVIVPWLGLVMGGEGGGSCGADEMEWNYSELVKSGSEQ